MDKMDIDQKIDGQHQKAKEIHRKTTINFKTNEKQRKTDEQLIEINENHRFFLKTKEKPRGNNAHARKSINTVAKTDQQCGT